MVHTAAEGRPFRQGVLAAFGEVIPQQFARQVFRRKNRRTVRLARSGRSRLVIICDDTQRMSPRTFATKHPDLAMTDYHSILAKAVDALDQNTPRARQRIYGPSEVWMC